MRSKRKHYLPGKEKTKPLSVCFFSHSSQLAGAERSLLELVAELIRDHGVVCTVVLPDIGPLNKKLEEAGASTLIAEYSCWCDLSISSDKERSRRQNNSFKSVIELLRKELRTIDPDVIFTNTLVIPWGAIAASFLCKPHVWFIHEFGKFDPSIGFHMPFDKILRIVRASSNIIITNSKAVKKTLFGDAVDPSVITVYQHIDIAPNALKKGTKHFTKDGSTKLIIAGTISKYKGQKDAIMAIKELTQRKWNVELIIAGYYNERYLKELKVLVKQENLEGCVKFIDFQENIYPVMYQADIVLICTKYEAFGRVTLEGMLLKKPIIGTNSGGTPELIKEGSNGLLFKPGDHVQLAEKIEYLLANKEKMRKYGKAGYKFAKKKFTKALYGGKIYKLLKSLNDTSNPSASHYSQFLLKNILHSFADFDVPTRNIRSSLRYKAGNLVAVFFMAIRDLLNQILLFLRRHKH